MTAKAKKNPVEKKSQKKESDFFEVVMKELTDRLAFLFGKKIVIKANARMLTLSLTKIVPKTKVGGLKHRPRISYGVEFIQGDKEVAVVVTRNTKRKNFQMEGESKKALSDIINEVIEFLLNDLRERCSTFYHHTTDLVAKKITNSIKKEKFQRYDNLDNDIYHKTDVLGRSMLLPLLDSYLEFENKQKEEFTKTEVMNKGSAFHSYVLTPKDFKNEVYVDDIESYAGTIGKQRKIVAEIAGLGKAIIKAKVMEEIEKGYEQLQSHKIAHMLYKCAKKEVSFFWTEISACGNFEESYKCRPDLMIELDFSNKNHVELVELLKETVGIKGLLKSKNLSDGDIILVDLKFTSNLSVGFTRKRAFDGGHLFQGAHYSKGVETATGKQVKLFFNINVQNTAPQDVVVDLLSDADLEAGEMQRNLALARYFYQKKNPTAYKGINEGVRILNASEYKESKMVEMGLAAAELVESTK